MFFVAQPITLNGAPYATTGSAEFVSTVIRPELELSLMSGYFTDELGFLVLATPKILANI